MARAERKVRPLTVVADNEGKVCDAIVRALEKRTKKTRTHVRHPDKEGIEGGVDLRVRVDAKEYAIEHTRIESCENEIETVNIANQIIRHVKENIPQPFPGPAYYELQFPVDIAWRKKRRRRALNELVECILEWERTLRERNAERKIAKDGPYWAYEANDSIEGRPDGFECDLHLLHWPSARHIGREPGLLGFRFIQPQDMEDRRLKRLQQAFDKKFRKLGRCKEEGARTILVLESSQSALGIFEFMGGLLPSALAGRTNAPDEIFLASTYGENWEVRPIKRDDGHWPDVGMPELGGCYYDPDNSDIPKWLATIPQRMRDNLQLDRMHIPYLRGWAPARFKEDELDEPTPSEALRDCANAGKP